MNPSYSMPEPLSFASYEFAQKKHLTRSEKSLAEIQQVVPWARLQTLIEWMHPTGGGVGRQPMGLPRMYLLQKWFGLADKALEDALYGSQSRREFSWLNLSSARDPEVHPTKKGNEWHFGMKAHTGAGTDSGPVRSLHITAANECNVAHTHAVLSQIEGKISSDMEAQ